MYDNIDHPDLQEVGRRLQERIDRMLSAEQQAAAVLSRRAALLRDRLLDAEDAGTDVTAVLIGGERHRGRLAATTPDHLELDTGAMSILIPFDALIAVVLQ